MNIWLRNGAGSESCYGVKAQVTYERVFNTVHRVGGMGMYYHRDYRDGTATEAILLFLIVNKVWRLVPPTRMMTVILRSSILDTMVLKIFLKVSVLVFSLREPLAI